MCRRCGTQGRLLTVALLCALCAAEIGHHPDDPQFYLPTDLGPHYAYTPGPGNLYQAVTVGSNTGWAGYLAAYDPS